MRSLGAELAVVIRDSSSGGEGDSSFGAQASVELQPGCGHHGSPVFAPGLEEIGHSLLMRLPGFSSLAR